MRFALLFAALALAAAAQPARVPVVYSTDLFHPHDDPDDHLDLVTLCALPEFELRAVLLDQGERQSRAPGTVALEQMSRLTGRPIVSAAGLAEKLQSPSDTGAGQPERFQGAVSLLLRTLGESREPVVIIQVGSSRDIVAAFNREPALFRSRVKAIYANIGNAEVGKGEWNVKLDPHAYVGLLRSGLPVYLCPCFPEKGPHGTFWKLTSYADAFDAAPLPLQSFFLYALHKVDPKELDPMAALGMNLRPWRALVWPRAKEMWSTASFLHAAGRGAEAAGAFRFTPARVEVAENGLLTRLETAAGGNMQLFERSDPAAYQAAMNACIRKIFARFPVRTR